MMLPIPKGAEWHTQAFDYGHQQGFALLVPRPALRNALRYNTATHVDPDVLRDMLLRWFWRKLGAI